MAETSIEWATHVWNPFTGCDRVSPGCANCYAAKAAKRLQAQELGRERIALEQGKPSPRRRYMNDGGKASGPGFGFTVHWDKLHDPERFPAGARVFVNSMSDVFHEDAPLSAIVALWRAFADQPDVNFLVLTKRPERMRDILAPQDVMLGRGLDTHQLPLPNVWLGVSIENRRFVHRADVLRDTPAAVRFISAEPLLGPLLPDGEYESDCDSTWRLWADDFSDHGGLVLRGIDWLIVGGESGPKARPMQLEWARDLVAAARWSGFTAPFVKQLGKHLGREYGAGPKGGDIEKWPADLRVREFPHVAVAHV